MPTLHKILTLLLLIPVVILVSCTSPTQSDQENRTEATDLEDVRWSEEQAWEWYNSYPWLAGCNFNPSTAINQLEFWQEETFDPETIDRELGWSADLGFNFHRVYLHNLLWDQDSVGFLARLDQFLTLADKHNVYIMFVLLDDVWHPVPKLGKQPDPVPHVHNSGWVQAPGAAILGDSSRHDELEAYIKGVVGRFADDRRVAAWDVYNEPDNIAELAGREELEVKDKHIYSLALLRKAFGWVRSANPSQPLTCGVWRGERNYGSLEKLPPLDRYMLENSDVISFHAYDDNIEAVQVRIDQLKKYNRPVLCTEYMARTNNNTFENTMPVLKQNNVAAINWGFVSGKTNTIYPWSSWQEEFTAEPEIWFHDVLRADGTPYSEEEVELIKSLTAKK